MSTMNKTLLTFAALGLAIAARAELPDKDGNTHMGVASCAASQCHGSAVPRDGSNVMQNEYVTWTQDDPHSKAFETLSSDASRAIDGNTKPDRNSATSPSPVRASRNEHLQPY